MQPIQEEGPIIYESDLRLINLLVAIEEGEAEIEASRQKLCAIPDFSLLAAFKIFDHDDDGTITSHEMAKFLQENKTV